MKADPALAVLELGRIDNVGRRLVRRRERAAILAAYEKSDLTQRAFATREGINWFTFCNWLRKARQAAVGRAASPPRFVEFTPPPVAAGYAFEVVLPSGVLVRGHSSQETAALVRALR